MRSDWLRHVSASASQIPIYDIARYREALSTVMKALAEAGLDACLFGGTLLGALRDGNFIAFDKDMDFGIDARVTPAQLDAVLSRDPRFRRVTELAEDAMIACYFFNDNVAIDFFRLYADGETIWCGLHWRGQLVKWRHRRFGLRDHEFLGVPTKIPEDPEFFLAEVYGDDWRTPNPYFAAWASPNMDGGFPPVARCLAYANIFKAAWSGDRRRAIDLCRQALALNPGNELVADIRQRVLEAQPSSGPSSSQAAVLGTLDDAFDDLT